MFAISLMVYSINAQNKFNRTVEDFQGIKVNLSDVFLTQSDTNYLIIETDDKMEKMILSKVKNGILEISFDFSKQRKYKWEDGKGPKAYIGVKTIHSIELKGTNLTTMNTINTDKWRIGRIHNPRSFNNSVTICVTFHYRNHLLAG